MKIFSAILLVCFLIFAYPVSADEIVESTCYGTTSKGRIENAVKLPAKGSNFQTYSLIAGTAGRTYIHSKVREVILNAYKSLEKSHPEKVFVYGEAGLKNGGRFKPHKTHQNGLSVDFFVPVVEGIANKHQKGKQKSVPMPTGLLNKFGYLIEFDKKGKFGNLEIDFEAMAAHIKALHIEAKRAGIDIWRVIFDPHLQPFLYQTKDGAYIKKNILIPQKRSWVRHDEHFHVDFKIKCKDLQ